MDKEDRGGNENADGSDAETEDEVSTFAREEGDGREDDGDLEESFSEIVTESFGFGVLAAVFVVFGRLLLFDYIRLPLLNMGFVFFALGGSCGREGWLQRHEIHCDRKVVHPDLFGLVFVPLIGCARLHEDRFGVAAVAKDGDRGDEDGEDGDGKRDHFEGFATFGRFFHLVGELVDFVGFHGG